MKIAIVSDIHGNFTALKKVHEHIVQQKCQKIFCLGDIVGYGPKPFECWSLIKHTCSEILKGNHEDAICTPSKEIYMNPYAVEGVSFSRSNLPDEVINEMRLLPTKKVIDELDLTICHGAYSKPSAWKYISNTETSKRELDLVPTRFCMVGHTHNPFVFGSKAGLYECITNDMELDHEERFLINVGSVGQPRDGDCRASYGTLEFKFKDSKVIKSTFKLHRVFYNILETYQEIEKANISSYLGDRLYRGG